MKSKEERKKFIESARGIARLGGSDVSEYFLSQADRYIEGETTIEEFENIIHNHYEKG